MEDASFRSVLQHLGRVLLPRDGCVNDSTGNTCEKPASSSHMTLAIVAGLVAVIIVVTVGVLLYLHFRRRRLDRHEDARHAHELTDYDDDDMMPQLPVKKPDGAVVTGYGNGRLGGGRPLPPGYSGGDARSARDADQFGSSVDSFVGGDRAPQTKGDPFADRGAGGGLR